MLLVPQTEIPPNILYACTARISTRLYLYLYMWFRLGWEPAPCTCVKLWRIPNHTFRGFSVWFFWPKSLRERIKQEQREPFLLSFLPSSLPPSFRPSVPLPSFSSVLGAFPYTRQVLGTCLRSWQIKHDSCLAMVTQNHRNNSTCITL